MLEKEPMERLPQRPLLSGLNINPIPLEFSQKLTTTEWLCEINARLSGMVEEVNNALTAVEEYYKEYDTYFNEELQKAKEELEEHITTLRDETEQAILDLHNWTEEQCKNNMMTLLAQFDLFRKEIYTYHDNSVKQILAKMDNEILRLEDEIRKYSNIIICPIDGRKETVQTVINHLYDLFRDGALTVDEFEFLELTVSRFESSNITCEQFAMESKKILKGLV